MMINNSKAFLFFFGTPSLSFQMFLCLNDNSFYDGVFVYVAIFLPLSFHLKSTKWRTFTLSLLLYVDLITIESFGNENEKLDCFHEEHNPFDWFTIKTVTSDGMIVDHLRREISRITKFFLDRGAVMQVELTSKHCRRSPLVKKYQGRRKILRTCQREEHRAKE